MVRAKIRAYMAQARVLPIQKNHPVRNDTGLGRMRLAKEYPPPASGMAAPSSLYVSAVKTVRIPMAR